MGYRRSKASVAAARDWAEFLAANDDVISRAGLPLSLTQSIQRWNDFLMHGRLDHHRDASGFTVDQLTEAQYVALVHLVESYFAQGYAFYSPTGLREPEQRSLRSRFGQ